MAVMVQGPFEGNGRRTDAPTMVTDVLEMVATEALLLV